MFNLTIKGTDYDFDFTIGFRREIDSQITKKIDGVSGKVENLGLNFAIAGIMDGNCEDIINVLHIANKKFDNNVSRKDLEEWLDNEVEDLDELCDKLLGFLRKANATARAVANLEKAVADQKAKAEAEANNQ